MRELGSSQPTAVELEILRILWELGPSPVRDIHAKLSEAKDTNYSTTVKMLAVMLTKGLLKRWVQGDLIGRKCPIDGLDVL